MLAVARTSVARARLSAARAFGGTAPSLQRQQAQDLPERARVVVVGGGIIGTSTAYHLAKRGVDVVLLERDQLTSGTTWHAAGLMVTFGSLSETSTELRKYTRALYESLEAETGQSTGFKPCGFIELATSAHRLEEYRRIAAFNRKCGVDVQEIGPEEVLRRFPLCKVEDVLAGFLVEGDGRVNPVDATMALAKGARMAGARIVEGCSVTGVTTSAPAGGGTPTVTGVTTAAHGVIGADFVVNCCGMWARQFGELAGVSVPLQAAEHYYLVTDAMDEVDPDWPVVEDPSSFTYIRPEGGGLMVGLFESEAAAWHVDAIPEDASFTEIEPDWERMAPFLEKAMARVPASLGAGMRTFFCGPESFTPDLAPCVGEAPELRNYFVGAGLNSIGILTGGGVGRLLAHWIDTGAPDMDVTGMNIDRLQRYQSNPAYRAARVVESLGNVYKCHYPHYQLATARGAKRSAVHARLEGAGACFRDVSGWEGADWYAPVGSAPADHVGELSFGRHDWWPLWEAEHAACREGVALVDMSFMSKFLVQGADAGRCLSWLANGDVDGAAGVITYAQMLNDAGKMEADVTVIKQAAGRFLVVATDTAHRHVETLIRRHLEDEGAAATIADVTGGYAQLNLQGPRARQLLASLTSADVSDAAFPFRAAREIDVGFGRAVCTRITYVGELGYELFVPAEHALHVWDEIVEKGSRVEGFAHVGLKALGSLRMEKGYRDFGHDMDNTDTVLECGLGFCCDFEKEGGFRGKEAVLAQKALCGPPSALPQRLCSVLLKDPAPLMYHGEVVLRDGVPVGDVRAASYAHTLGGAMGLTMIKPEHEGTPINKAYLSSGVWEVDVAGTRYPAALSLQPMYDPKNERIKSAD